MSTTTSSGSTSFKEWMTTILIGLVSLTCVAAAIVRTVKQDYVPDQEGLLFLVVAVVVQFLDRVSKFKFAGLEFEKKVEDLEGRVEELAELNQGNDEGPAPEMIPAPSRAPSNPASTEETSSEAPPPGGGAVVASLDEAARAIAEEIYRPGLTWDDDTVGDYFTESSAEGLSLSAKISPSRNYQKRYLVQVSLHVTKHKDLSDPRVVFFLHHTFRRRMRFEAIYNGTATLTLTARGAFVIGAVLADGTMLRLDLANATMNLSDDERDDFLSH